MPRRRSHRRSPQVQRRRAKPTNQALPLAVSVVGLAVVIMLGSWMFAWLFRSSVTAEQPVDLASVPTVRTDLMPPSAPDATGR